MAQAPKKPARGKARNVMATIADLLKQRAKNAPPPGFTRRSPAMIPGGAAPSPDSMMPGASQAPPY